MKRAYEWILGEGSAYALIGTLAIIDGNLISSAAAGLFTIPASALIFGALCFSGVGCITTIISSRMDLKVKILGIFLIRTLSILPGLIVVTAGVILGCYYTFSKYVAMAVVASVSIGIGLGYLPSFRIGKININFTLLVLIVSIIVSYPLSHFSWVNINSMTPSLFSSIFGLLISIFTAIVLDSLAAIFSQSITKILDIEDMRLVGSICLMLLAFGPIGGFISISSYEILLLLIFFTILLTLRRKVEVVKKQK